MFEFVGTIFGLACLAVLVVVCVSMQFDLAPKDPKWWRRWAVFAYSVFGLLAVWMVILFGFIK